MVNLEYFLREKLAKEKVTLIDPEGIEYTFSTYEPRHTDHDFCLTSKEHNVSQFPYKIIKNWKIKEE